MRRGIFTSELWATIGVVVLVYATGDVPPTWQAGLATATTVGYIVSRGLAKLGRSQQRREGNVT